MTGCFGSVAVYQQFITWAAAFARLPAVRSWTFMDVDARDKLALVSKENQNTRVRLIVLRQMKFRLVH
jgi:hypothetical protein